MATPNKCAGLCKVCRTDVPAMAGIVKRHPGAVGRHTYGLWIILCQDHKNTKFPRIVNA
jgi:hypothetical protein